MFFDINYLGCLDCVDVWLRVMIYTQLFCIIIIVVHDIIYLVFFDQPNFVVLDTIRYISRLPRDICLALSRHV